MIISCTYSDLAAVEGLWKEIAPRSDNIFSTWEWADAWWRHFGGGGSLCVRCVSGSEGQPMALLPLYRERRSGLTLTRLLGQGVADQLGPVCGPTELGSAREELRRAGGDVLLAERLGGEADWTALGGQVLRSEASPAIVLPKEGGWEDYLQDRSANFRQQVRRRARKLAGALGVRFRLSDDPGRLAGDMDALIGLHAAQWGGRSRAFRGEREAFHREFAARALEQGWLRLWLAEAEGTPVAAWYGFRFGAAEYFYQSGRDPAWDRYRIGAGMLEHSMREAFTDGMREYRLLRGDEDYKQRYATETRRLVTIAVPSTVSGNAAVIAASVAAATGSGRRLLRKLAAGRGDGATGRAVPHHRPEPMSIQR